jgi:hypothetical protein
MQAIMYSVIGVLVGVLIGAVVTYIYIKLKAERDEIYDYVDSQIQMLSSIRQDDLRNQSTQIADMNRHIWDMQSDLETELEKIKNS